VADPNVETIASYIRPPDLTLDATDAVRIARRRMEGDNVRSLVVLKNDRYFGVIDWHSVRRLSGAALSEPIEKHARRDIPTLTPYTTIAAAMSAFHKIDVAAHGLLPVINAAGRLEGLIERDEFQGLMEDSAGTITVREDPVAHLLRGADVPRAGAKVVSAEGRKLGSFQRHVEDRGRPRWIEVQHGFLWRKRIRRVPLVAIERQTPREIVLSIGIATWRTFRDQPRDR
jgi:CBS domain-containing protein